MNGQTADHIRPMAGAAAGGVKLALILVFRVAVYGDDADCRTRGVGDDDWLSQKSAVRMGNHQSTAAAGVAADAAPLVLRASSCSRSSIEGMSGIEAAEDMWVLLDDTIVLTTLRCPPAGCLLCGVLGQQGLQRRLVHYGLVAGVVDGHARHLLPR